MMIKNSLKWKKYAKNFGKIENQNKKEVIKNKN